MINYIIFLLFSLKELLFFQFYLLIFYPSHSPKFLPFSLTQISSLSIRCWWHEVPSWFYGLVTQGSICDGGLSNGPFLVLSLSPSRWHCMLPSDGDSRSDLELTGDGDNGFQFTMMVDCRCSDLCEAWTEWGKRWQIRGALGIFFNFLKPIIRFSSNSKNLCYYFSLPSINTLFSAFSPLKLMENERLMWWGVLYVKIYFLKDLC